MPIILDNLDWMTYNVVLAILGVSFGWIYYILNNRISYLFLPIWLLFLPNTIYLLTDIEHLISQWLRIDDNYKLILIIQYIVLFVIGISTYLLAMQPLNKFFKSIRINPKSDLALLLIILLNFAIGLAMVLGKFQRTHSWYVFTQPTRVIADIFSVFNTPSLLAMLILSGLITNLVYFIYYSFVIKNSSSKHPKK